MRLSAHLTKSLYRSIGVGLVPNRSLLADDTYFDACGAQCLLPKCIALTQLFQNSIVRLLAALNSLYGFVDIGVESFADSGDRCQALSSQNFVHLPHEHT